MIELVLKGQKLAVHTPLLVAGTVDYLTVQIHRDGDEWKDLSLHVFFQRRDGVTYEILTNGDFIGTDAHLNLSAGEWSVSVVGYEYENGDMVEKVTTNTIGVTVAPAPPDAGASLPDIPATAYEQIEAIAQSVRTDADNGVFDGEKGDPGDQGPVGPVAAFSIGTVSTLSAGSAASATITGTDAEPILNLGIPKGDKGDKGSKGDTGSAGSAATVSVGTVTTLAAGSDATVTNAGTSSAAVFNFGIPKGDKGDQGDQGEQGEQGPAGADGQDGASITVSSNVIEYQEGSSGTAAPTGDWTTTIPSVTAGNYLWTRVTTTFSDGASAVSYSVSRMGIDGSGSVVTVNSKSPDGNGNVQLAASDVGALADTYTAPVTSVNSKTGAVSLSASDVGALADTYTAPVTSVNTKTGAVSLSASDVGALPDTYSAADLLFGLGTAIASNADCDTIVTEGKYTCANQTVAASLSNAPYPGAAFGLWVLRVAEAQRLVQIAMVNSSNITIKLRYKGSSTWSAWVTLTPS